MTKVTGARDVPPRSPRLVRSGVLQNFSRALAEFDVPAGPLLAEFGLTEALIDYGEVPVDVALVGRLLERAVAVTGARHFPTVLSSHQNGPFLGSIWLILQTSTTLGEALTDISRYIHLHADPVTWRVEQGPDLTSIAVGISGDRLPPLQQCLAIDLSLAQCYLVLNSLAGKRIRLERVTVHYQRLESDRHQRRYFGAPMVYTAEADALVVATRELSRRIDHGDTTALHEVISQQISTAGGARAAATLAQEVQAIIRSLLPMQRCSLDRVARLYGCDKRTLQRHLDAECGTSYQQLLDDTRYHAACRYLENSQLPLTRVSAMVGFGQPSNFARAFKARMGVSPSQWRAQHQVERPRRLHLKLRQAPDAG